MTTRRLLIIDPQNDFCDTPPELRPAGTEPALAVAGAHRDMLRLAEFIDKAGDSLERIVVTLDSHPFVAIERVTFWLDAQGQQVAPFTQITAADLQAGRFRPRFPPATLQAKRVVQELERIGRPGLIVWPVHCVTGTWGHTLHPAVAQALNEWELRTGATVRKVLKGEYPLAEHYGVFEAETPTMLAESTLFNEALADSLSFGVDELLVAGEASSHCVAASIDQLVRHRRGDATGITLLTDCMSPVTGFKAAADAFLVRAHAAGAELSTSAALLAGCGR